MKGKKPLEEAMLKPKKELHQNAKYLLSQAESQLLMLQPLSSGADVDRHLRAEIDVLNRLLKEHGDDLGAIQFEMEEMRVYLAGKVKEGQRSPAKPAS